MVRVDLRTVTLDVPPQNLITRDNVPAKVNAVCYFRVIDAPRSVVDVERYLRATSQIAQTTLRSVLGKADLDMLLSEREQLNEALQHIIDEHTDPWGIKVTTVEIKDVEIPVAMQHAMALGAQAERERRAKIIHAEGEYQASQRLRDAADVISGNPAALQLRYMQTLTEIGATQNSTVVFPLPLDMIKPFIDASAALARAEAPELPADARAPLTRWGAGLTAEADPSRAALDRAAAGRLERHLHGDAAGGPEPDPQLDRARGADPRRPRADDAVAAQRLGGDAPGRAGAHRQREASLRTACLDARLGRDRRDVGGAPVGEPAARDREPPGARRAAVQRRDPDAVADAVGEAVAVGREARALELAADRVAELEALLRDGLIAGLERRVIPIGRAERVHQRAVDAQLLAVLAGDADHRLEIARELDVVDAVARLRRRTTGRAACPRARRRPS